MRIVVLLLALTTGCSWMSSRPVRHYPNGSVDCSTGKGAPTVDVLMATTLGIGGLAAASDSAGAAILPLGLAAVYALSASHGFKQAGECREAIANMSTESEPDVERAHWAAPSPAPEAASDDETNVEAPKKVSAEIEIDASELEP